MILLPAVSVFVLEIGQWYYMAIVIPSEYFCKAVYSERLKGINYAHVQVLNGERNSLVRDKQRHFAKLVCEMLIVVFKDV